MTILAFVLELVIDVVKDITVHYICEFIQKLAHKNNRQES